MLVRSWPEKLTLCSKKCGMGLGLPGDGCLGLAYAGSMSSASVTLRFHTPVPKVVTYCLCVNPLECTGWGFFFFFFLSHTPEWNQLLALFSLWCFLLSLLIIYLIGAEFSLFNRPICPNFQKQCAVNCCVPFRLSVQCLIPVGFYIQTRDPDLQFGKVVLWTYLHIELLP